MSSLSQNVIQAFQPAAAGKQILYTLCPEALTSRAAFELGWLDEELYEVGASAASLPWNDQAPDAWSRKPGPHNLLREGNIDTLVGCAADVRETRLIGINAGGDAGGQVLVRFDSNFHLMTDLAGKRIGVLETEKGGSDWLRAVSERGIRLAFLRAGLKREQWTLVDVPADFVDNHARDAVSPEIQALLDGRVDAVFSAARQTSNLLKTGKIRVIQDLGHYPDWTLRVNNTPIVSTVSAELADEHPEIVIAYLRATIRAGQWINANRHAAAELFFPTSTKYSTLEDMERSLATLDFVPNLSGGRIDEVHVSKGFLLQHGYIRSDFDVREWAAPQFLRRAHASF